MKKKMKYSVLRYSPRLRVGESINLGLIVVDEENKKATFTFSKKRSRIEAFDDEVSYSAVLRLMQSIKKDVEGYKNRNEDISIEKYTKYYINAFYFDKPMSIDYLQFDETVEKLRKIFLWFDYDHKERISKNESVKFFKQVLQANGTKTISNRFDVGIFEDTIKYDLQTEKYNIVLFDLNEKNLSKIINSAKLWSWNSKHHKSDRQMLFVLKDNGMNEQDYRVVIRVLKEASGRIIYFNDALDLINRSDE